MWNLVCMDSFLSANTARCRIFREYLRENELLSKTILACLSEAQMASIQEIKKCPKILWHCPFNWLGISRNLSAQKLPEPHVHQN